MLASSSLQILHFWHCGVTQKRLLHIHHRPCDPSTFPRSHHTATYKCTCRGLQGRIRTSLLSPPSVSTDPKIKVAATPTSSLRMQLGLYFSNFRNQKSIHKFQLGPGDVLDMNITDSPLILVGMQKVRKWGIRDFFATCPPRIPLIVGPDSNAIMRVN